MKATYISISVIVLVLLSGTLLTSGYAMNSVYARYSKTQSQANANTCSIGTNCGITSPQTQGDSSASSPTNLQISRFNEEASSIPPASGSNNDFTAHMQINTFVNCPQDSACPQSNDFRYHITPNSSECPIHLPPSCILNVVPETFTGLTTVTFTIINSGNFSMTVTPPSTSGLTLQQPLEVSCVDSTIMPIKVLTQSGPDSFNGTIRQGDTAFCNIGYTYR
jgi:hypothetical protein